MVKLASARESRMYGPRLGRNRLEYMNAGLYIFATILLLSGFSSLLSYEARPALVLILIGLGLIVLVNLHDLIAHLAGIDYRFALMEYDMQLGLVEFAVPLLQLLGTLLFFLALLFIFIQGGKAYDYYKLETHAENMLIAGTTLWVVGSVLNSCQIYERADGHVQVLQQCVQVPFLMGSLLLLVASVINYHADQTALVHHGHRALLGASMIWLGIVGSLMLFIGGITNLVKVFKMQQIDGIRLEKLRGGAQECLIRGREGQVRPLIAEDHRRRKISHAADNDDEEAIVSTSTTVAVVDTPYKDVLVGHA